MTYVKAGDDETWPLRQHRQHRLRPYWAPAGLGVHQLDGYRPKRHWRDPRNVVLSRVRAHYAADGADGIFERRAHPDDSASGSPFTTEGNVDAQRPKKCLRPTQVAGEGAGIFGPADAVACPTIPAAARFRGRAGCSGFTPFRMPTRERQAARSVFRVMSPRPASRPAMEISSSMSSQWRPVRLSSTLSRWAAVACSRRGNQANGTPNVRPSLSSTHIACSSNRTAVAEMLMPCPQDQVAAFHDNA